MPSSRLLALVSLALAATTPAQASPRAPVVGGTPSQPGRWNDAAVILYGDVPGCTGTLIAPDLVLTAGHCIGGVSRVKLGEVDITSPDGEVIVVAREVEHPDSFSTYDVGLLILERPSRYEPRVIATGCVLEQYAVNGADVEIVGWGSIDPEGGQETDVLMEGRSVITDIDCTGGRGCNTAVVPAGELGAGGDSVDSCFGDSGGPLYLLTDIGEYLIGVTSRGYDDATRPCGDGGIYVRADAVLEWIESESGETLPRADCDPPSDEDDGCGCRSSRSGAGGAAAIAIAALLALVPGRRRRL